MIQNWLFFQELLDILIKIFFTECLSDGIFEKQEWPKIFLKLSWNFLDMNFYEMNSFNSFMTNLLCKWLDWFLYDRDLRHERVISKSHFTCRNIYYTFYIILLVQACWNEKNSGGAPVYEIFWAIMVGRRRKFFVSNCLKRLERLIFVVGEDCKFTS